MSRPRPGRPRCQTWLLLTRTRPLRQVAPPTTRALAARGADRRPTPAAHASAAGCAAGCARRGRSRPRHARREPAGPPVAAPRSRACHTSMRAVIRTGEPPSSRTPTPAMAIAGVATSGPRPAWWHARARATPMLLPTPRRAVGRNGVGRNGGRPRRARLPGCSRVLQSCVLLSRQRTASICGRRGA